MIEDNEQRSSGFAKSSSMKVNRADLTAMLRLIRHQWVLVASCAAVAGAAALAYSLAVTPQYTASAQLLFRNPALDSALFGSIPFKGSSDPAREAATNLALANVPMVSQTAAKTLGAGFTSGRVRSAVTVAPSGASDVVYVSATDPSPEAAAAMANAYAASFVQVRQKADRAKVELALSKVTQELQAGQGGEAAFSGGSASLQNQADQLRVLQSLQTGNAEVIQAASPPGDPSSPQTNRNVILALFLGFLIGVGTVLLKDRLNNRLRTPDQLAELTGLPILCTVPESENIDLGTRLSSPETEAFTMLRARLKFFNVDRKVRILLVTSPEPSDGKSSVAFNVALNAAEAGLKVALVEADLRSPGIALDRGLRSTPGVSELASGATNLQDCIQTIPSSVKHGTGLDVIVAGAIPPNPAELMQSERLHQILQDLSEDHELVIVDSPPILAVADTTSLLSRVDGAILVGRVGKTHRRACADAYEQLRQIDAPMLGVVVNGMNEEAAGYGYGYGYGYGEAPPVEVLNGSDTEDEPSTPGGAPTASSTESASKT